MKYDPHDILIRPLVTEKTTTQSGDDKVTFEIPLDAGKKDVKAAIKQVFGIDAVAVNTLVVKGKTKSLKGRAYRRSDKKKAIVTLPKGREIDVTGGA